MKNNKILLIVESVQRASDGSARPVVTAIRPVPWWLRLWDRWRRTRETQIPLDTDQQGLDNLTTLYALEADTYVLNKLMRPHEHQEGCTVSTARSSLRMTITPDEDTIMSVFNAMLDGKPITV
jgi:hypothetical protein